MKDFNIDGLIILAEAGKITGNKKWYGTSYDGHYCYDVCGVTGIKDGDLYFKTRFGIPRLIAQVGNKSTKVNVPRHKVWKLFKLLFVYNGLSEMSRYITNAVERIPVQSR